MSRHFHTCFFSAITVACIAGLSAGCIQSVVSRIQDRDYRVSVTKDIVYKSVSLGDDNVIALSLDIYEPAFNNAADASRETGKTRPLLMWIHGGGFFMGDKADEAMVKLSTHFADQGFVCASINYRLMLEHPADWTNQGLVGKAVDAAAEDARDALDFLAGNKDALGIDTAAVVIGGSSAGGFTALHAAYAGRGQVRGVKINAVIDFWGGLLDASLLTAGAPPLFVVHGTADLVVPYRYARRLLARAAEIDLPMELHTLEGEGHAAWSRMDEYCEWITGFLAAHCATALPLAFPTKPE